MLRRVTVKKVFLILYILNLVCLFAVRLVGAGLFSKFRYLYIIALFVLSIADKNRRGNSYFGRVFLLLIPLIIHTVLFCFVFTNVSISSDTLYYARELIIFILMLILTVGMINKYDMLSEVVEASYWCFAVFVAYCYVTHFNRSASLQNIYRLFAGKRWRFSFGLGSSMEAGMYSAFVLQLATYRLYKNGFNIAFTKKALVLIRATLNISAFLVLVSSGSISPMIETAVFVAVMIYFHIKKRFSDRARMFGIFEKTALLVFLAALIYIIISKRYIDIFDFVHRGYAYRINSKAFNAYGNKLTGMGYGLHYLFYSQAYGFQTFALDSLYLYIYYTTGIVGSAILGIQLIIWAIGAFRSKYGTAVRALCVGIFIIQLLSGITEISYIDPCMISVLVYMFIFIACISKANGNNDLQVSKKP